MPSRKRTKGKERKVKNQARGPVERAVSQPTPTNGPSNGMYVDMCNWELNCKMNKITGKNMCSHGCVIPPQRHPVHDFMNTWDEAMHNFMNTWDEGIKRKLCGFEAMCLAFEKHTEVLKDAKMRKMIINIFLSIGTNLILIMGVKDLREIIKVIILLEHYNGEDNLDSAYVSGFEEVGYLDGSGERDMINFFKKRLTCSCLKEKYSEVKKSQDKSSVCFQCDQIKNSKNLMTCSRCKWAHYCSKECQKLDWPSHKAKCKELCDYRDEVARRNKGV